MKARSLSRSFPLLPSAIFRRRYSRACKQLRRLMPAIIRSEQVEEVLRLRLREEGYILSANRAYGETGTDIIASKGTEQLHIEAIAFKSSPPARSKDFYEIFFRAISRIKLGATLCVIALPKRFGDGLHQRASAIGAGWVKLGDAFPQLEIWLVDTEQGTYRRTTWNSWTD